MRVLVVSGIWPPDVGGPASHAPQLASFLAGRGHTVEAVVTAVAPPALEAYPVRFVRRSLPPGLRHLAVARLVASRARRADVVYVTSMIGRAAAGCVVARTPFVIKLVADPAYERARRGGEFDGRLEEFGSYRGGLRVATLRRVRNAAVLRAAHVICPSAYLARLAGTWGVPETRVSVVPNPAPELGELASREELRARVPVEGALLVFAGRLTQPKALDVALDAVARVDGTHLLVVGDGPERPALEEHAHRLRLNGRVTFAGSRPRTEVLELLRAADAAILTSTWENFPHGVVEALAVGTPVIATAVGGVGEVVTDHENGLLVEPGDAEAFAAALRQFLADEGLARRLRAAAPASVSELAPDRVLTRIEELLERVVGR